MKQNKDYISIKRIYKKIFRPIIRMAGLDLVRYKKDFDFPPDFDELDIRIFKSVKEFTMTNTVNIYAIIRAVKYVIQNEIEGNFVECGVWKGGSIMTMALVLKEFGKVKRDIYLYDTFSGMSEPTLVDVSFYGESAQKIHARNKKYKNLRGLLYSPLEEVKKNVYSTGYPKDKFHFIKGKVENTLPKYLPEKIALLRLDTDWYESTKHELKHLFPLLSSNGVIIIDDYGYWLGAKKAVDEYLSENKVCILLNRIDDSSRIGVKAG